MQDLSEINKLLGFLKECASKSAIKLPYVQMLDKFYESFPIKKYEASNFNCELAQLVSGEEAAIETFKAVYSKKHFELKHPFNNDIVTRAVKTCLLQKEHTLIMFLVDSNNKFPWVTTQIYGLGEIIITPNGVYSPAEWLLKGHGEVSRWCKWMIFNELRMLLPHIKPQDLAYKDAKFIINLTNPRPMHFFQDDLQWFYALEPKCEVASIPSFFCPKGYKHIKRSGIANDIVKVKAMLGHYGYDAKLKNAMYEKTYKESLESINERLSTQEINSDADLTIWLGIPGERRSWLEQFVGIPAILERFARVFNKIVVYIDGMTSLDGERHEIKDNLELFNKIKSCVDSLGLNIALKSLAGLDYRTKMCYCSLCDIAIGDSSTTSLVPFNFAKKPGVIFYGTEMLCAMSYNLAANIKHCKAVDKNFVLTCNKKSLLVWDFHIPWEYIYNLAAESLEGLSEEGRIKSGVKLERLEVPSVEVVAKQYEIKERFGITLNYSEIPLFLALEASFKSEIEAIKAQNVESQSLKQIPQTAIPQLRGAKERVKGHLAYKLGAALIVCSKSFLGYLQMPFVLSYIKKQHKVESLKYKDKIAKNPHLKLPKLEDYADYKDALKEMQCLTYKLGEALMRANKNWYKGGYVWLYFETKRLKEEFRR